MTKEQRILGYKIAATYIGTVVGAGFATGKEISQFFTVNGLYGAIGIFISGILFIWLGTKMMLLSLKIGAFSTQEFNRYLFGTRLGNIINIMLLLTLISVTSVMLSGAGAVFEEQLGYPRQIGIVLTIILTLFVLSKDIKGIFSINAIVVPIMMLFILGVSYSTIDQVLPYLGNTIPQESWNYKWITNPLIYVSLNLTLSQSVLIPLATEVKDRKAILLGGILGGIGLFTILLSSHLAISSIENFHTYNVPLGELLRHLNPTFHFIFAFIILGEIVTTVIGNVYGISKQLQSILSMRSYLIVVVTLGICYAISFVSYSPLLSFLYPLIGWLSIIMIPLIVFKKTTSAT